MSVSQSVSYFTVPPRAHPSTGSQSGSATPGSNTSTEYSLARGLLNYVSGFPYRICTAPIAGFSMAFKT